MLGGCSKKFTIYQQPEFYDGSIKAIAVTPFRNQTSVADAGNTVSDRLAAALIANGTYKVYNRNDHRVLSDERDLQLDLGQDPEKVEAMFRQLGDVQAILIGVVSTYAGTSNSQPRQEPIQQYNAYTKSWYVAGYRSYVWTRNEVNVAVTAALLRRDGSTIYATPVPATAQAWAEGSPPEKDIYALLTQANGLVVQQLVEQFAIVPKEIKVDPNKALRFASELFENKWTFVDRFATDSEEMYVVLELPNNCDRNRFAIKIVRKDKPREYLASQQITWDGQHKSFGYNFNPKQIAKKGNGPGLYTAKFFSGPEPIFTRDFRIQ